jgi:hypothetical protein
MTMTTPRRRRWLDPRAAALALAALACACASEGPYGRHEAPSAVTAEDKQGIDDAERALAPAERQLEAAGAAPAPDCARACALATNVCVLAERICAIAARYPAGDPVAAHCPDGRARCQRARARTDSCSCQSPR